LEKLRKELKQADERLDNVMGEFACLCQNVEKEFKEHDAEVEGAAPRISGLESVVKHDEQRIGVLEDEVRHDEQRIGVLESEAEGVKREPLSKNRKLFDSRTLSNILPPLYTSIYCLFHWFRSACAIFKLWVWRLCKLSNIQGRYCSYFCIWTTRSVCVDMIQWLRRRSTSSVWRDVDEYEKTPN
jgi:hypothetical protein